MTPPDHLPCAACGAYERAAEGAPCAGCEAFLCALCTLRGVIACAACEAAASSPPATS